MNLFRDLCVPAFPVLVRMEVAGLPCDGDKLRELRDDTEARLIAAERRTVELAADFHRRRREALVAGIESSKEVETHEIDNYPLWVDAGDATVGAPIPCTKHPNYRGLTKRAKCPGCAAVYGRAEGLRRKVRDFRAGRAKLSQRLRQIGTDFLVSSDAHWRELLFENEAGFKLKPVAWTGKARLASVDAKAIEKLWLKHPEIELLRLRAEAKKCASRLANRLSVEPDEHGRVHFAFAMHRSPSRLSSGSDMEEADKQRESEGNSMNIPERDRIIYRAEPGYVWLVPDWSQIEARLMAWIARETSMLAAWREGRDVHAENGLALWRKMVEIDLYQGEMPTLERVDEATFWFEGEQRTFRYAAKRMTHGWHYGMEGPHTDDLYGLPDGVGEILRQAYFAVRPRLAAFQREEVETATRTRMLTSWSGRTLWFWGFKRRKGEWELSDKKTALSFRPQRGVLDMLLYCLPQVEKLAREHGARPLGCPHDAFWIHTPEAQVPALAPKVKALMEREWPELGEIPGFGRFHCPAEFAVGRNLAPYHVHDDRCPRMDGALVCPKPLNPEGVKKVKHAPA